MNIEKFEPINKNIFEKFQNCLKNQGYCNSESSLATMYMWQHYKNAKYCIENETIFSFYRDKQGGFNFFMPYGVKRNSHQTIDMLLGMCQDAGISLVINLCTEDFVDFIVSSGVYDYSVTENRNSFDYIYYTDDLINLSGKKYHSKKNHINSFCKKYDFEYVKYTCDMKEECLEFCKKVLKQYYASDEKSYDTELDSISKTFDSLKELNLKCAVIKSDGEILALSVGERLNKDCALIHIEKADYNYRTAYSVINNLFLKNEFSDTIYVNREEDMGIEGLRKAKMSYNPCKFIKKYTVVINGKKERE